MSTVDGKVRVALEELSEHVRSLYGGRLVCMWLYGSYARGDARESSDVDVLLVLRGDVEPGLEIDRVVDVLAQINLRHEVLVSVVPVSEDDFRAARGPFWRNVRKEGLAA